MVTVWSKTAKKQLQAAYEFIKRDSFQNAEKIRDEIINLSISIANKPGIFPLDRYKINNDGTYRAFELHHYRVSYKVLNDRILIVRLRHTRRNPLTF